MSFVLARRNYEFEKKFDLGGCQNMAKINYFGNKKYRFVQVHLCTKKIYTHKIR